MNGTLGYGLVLLGIATAMFGAVVGLSTGLRKSGDAFVWVVRAVKVFALSMLAANAVMIYALVTHDFSVKYVAQVGSKATPLLFTVVSLWSALEGSILFWGAILAVYVLAFTLVHQKESPRYMSLAVGTMLAVCVFFAFLIAGPANPFEAIPNPPTDGRGPNPLLQNHILMVIHPPMLYLGYVGMVVPFGVAAGGLMRGELSEAWMVPLRRWTLIPFGFLSVGIILGAWWAYAVLGWGGYWAWDPVENASLLPWLTSTAFIHSTMVQERKRMLKLWTLSLALVTFILTILGTFMTRSGVFNSVHSFTQSDIGPTFLVFIGILIVFSVALLALRGPLLVAEDGIRSVTSREFSILINNLLFTAVTFTVLLGTLFPLLVEALHQKKLSVSEPYFNKMALPPAIFVLFLMGVGPVLPWGGATQKTLKQLIVPSAVGAITVVVCLVQGLRGVLPLLTFGLSGFVTVITLRELFLPVWIRMREHREFVGTALVRSVSRARRRFGGYVVHLGMVGIFVAVAASSAYVTHTTGTLTPGKNLQIGPYQIAYKKLASGREPHRDWVAAELEVTGADGQPRAMSPRMNFYEGSNDPIGTPAVWSRPGEDLYLSLLSFSDEENHASVNAWIFPLVGWIWWSIPLLVLGTLIAAWPARRVRVATAGPAETVPSNNLSGAA